VWILIPATSAAPKSHGTRSGSLCSNAARRRSKQV
jgi:hypothetical protein